MARTLVIIPTYDEADNVQRIVPQILSQQKGVEVLIVDDNSPDGTASLVENLMESDSRVHLIKRRAKMGLGTAYVEGFRYACAHGYDYVFEMDADFSHDPAEIPKFTQRMDQYDLVIGSRYRNGVRVVNWPIRRLLLSYFANVYSRIITGLPIKDATGGFKCYRRAVLEAIDLDSIHSNGYAFQIEMSFKTWKKGFRLCEIPITFVDRRAGVSKMSKRIVYEAVFVVWKLRLRSLIGRL
ncbi:MAG: polyprenol monophosphomannose synthase [Bacteroidota bacterium]